MQTKCHHYWPGMEPQTFGDIQVSMVSEKEKEDWTVREFELLTLSVSQRVWFPGH